MADPTPALVSVRALLATIRNKQAQNKTVQQNATYITVSTEMLRPTEDIDWSFVTFQRGFMNKERFGSDTNNESVGGHCCYPNSYLHPFVRDSLFPEEGSA